MIINDIREAVEYVNRASVEEIARLRKGRGLCRAEIDPVRRETMVILNSPDECGQFFAAIHERLVAKQLVPVLT